MSKRYLLVFVFLSVLRHAGLGFALSGGVASDVIRDDALRSTLQRKIRRRSVLIGITNTAVAWKSETRISMTLIAWCTVLFVRVVSWAPRVKNPLAF
jgi:hypothetical protein